MPGRFAERRRHCPRPSPAMAPWNPLGQQYCPNLRPCQNSPLKASDVTQKMLESLLVASSTARGCCHATRGTRKADRAQWFCAPPRVEPVGICLAPNRRACGNQALHMIVIKRLWRRPNGGSPPVRGAAKPCSTNMQGAGGGLCIAVESFQDRGGIARRNRGCAIGFRCGAGRCGNRAG